MDEMLETERVGVVVKTLDHEAYVEAARRALRLAAEPYIKERCTEAAHRNFDLVGVGGARYRSVYERVRIQS
jgi:DNA-binding transcriptional regulator LsrR (DeoR family)